MISLCNLCDLSVSVVNITQKGTNHRDAEGTEEAQRLFKYLYEFFSNLD